MVVLLSIERLFAVYMPHNFKVIFSKVKVKVIIAIIMALLITWNIAFHYTKTWDEDVTPARNLAGYDDGTMTRNDTTYATLKRGLGNPLTRKGKIHHK